MSLYTARCIALAILVLWSMGAYAQGTPLVADPGFESTSNDSAWVYPSPSFGVDADVKRSGESALRWQNANADRYKLAIQSVELSLDHEYQLQGWVKTEGVAGDGATLAVEYFASDHFLGGMYPPGLNGTRDWTRVQTDTFVLPQEATHAQIVCYARKGSTGTAWFDDIEIVRVPEPAFESLLTRPVYRGWLWEHGPQRVEVGIDIADPTSAGEDSAVWLTAFDRVGASIAHTYQPVGEVSQHTLKLDAADWPIGSYVAVVEWRDADGTVLHRAAHDLTVRSTEDQPKVYIDDHRRLIVRGQPVFPIGVYARKGLPQSTLDLLQDTPFNLVLPYSDPNRNELDRAQAAGVMYAASIKDYFAGSKFAPAGLDTPADEGRLIRPIIWDLRDHPALLCWYINDELPPSFIPQAAAHHRWVVQDDPDHPTWTVLQRPHQVGRYTDTFDVIGTDPYPLPGKPIRLVTEWTDRTIGEVKNARPLWQVIQAFDWHNYPGTQDRPGGTPTIPQLRNMVWQAVAAGANGIVLYSMFDLVRAQDIEFDAYWPQVVELAEELAAYAPLLLSTQPAPAVTVTTGSDESTLECRTMAFEGRRYILAVNASQTAESNARFQLDQAATKIVDLTDNRDLKVESDTFEDVLPPLAVRFYAIDSTHADLPDPQRSIPMPKTAAAIATTLLLSTGVSPQTLDFESDTQTDIPSLTAEHGLTFAGETESIETHNKDGFLRLGGNTEQPPRAIWQLGESKEKGVFTVTVGTTTSAADGYLRAMAGEKELFRLRLQSRNIVRVEADKSRTLTSKTHAGLDIATLGTGSSYDNRLVAEFAWDRTTNPPVFQYRLSQPGSTSDTPLTTDWVTNLDFAADASPDRIVIETKRHDNDSRDLLIYELKLATPTEPVSQAE